MLGEEIRRQLKELLESLTNVGQVPNRDEAGPSSVRRRVDATETSSGWSGSWIEKWLNPGETSSAPGDGQQPQGEVDQPASNVMEEEALDPTQLKIQITRVFFQIKGRNPRRDVLQELFDDLRLETASGQKRRQIVLILEEMKGDESLKVKVEIADSIWN